MPVVLSGARYVSPALCCAVLNDDAGAVRQSKAMNGDTPPVFAVVALSCASARKLFFFLRMVGVGLGKGARACGKRSIFATPEKKRHIDFGAWVGYYVV